MDALAVALVGAELEENLSLRYLAATLQGHGFRPLLLLNNDASDNASVLEAVLAAEPLAVGLSIPFQSRARELLGLANALRLGGYGGHVVAGGHFATFEYASILRDHPGIDSIVRHEGELTLVELCRRLHQGKSLAGVAGLVWRDEGSMGSASVVVEPARKLPPLDSLSAPMRPASAHQILGIPIAPILGSRGCYADCSFCCIHAYQRNARGPRYRQRSPENIAAEMAHERRRRGVGIFVFHDDNFFVASREKNLRRYERLHHLLRREGLDDIALVIKCRPNDVDAELFGLLKSMGLIRAYVGIESNSAEGLVSLHRRISAQDNARALHILQALDVFCSFNVLLFDPEASFAGFEENLRFMESHAQVPWNFCRAEVYAGTPLRHILESEQRLEGDYLGWSYQLREARMELLYRVVTTAFRSRTLKSDGVSNLNMGLRYDLEVARHFYADVVDDVMRDAGFHLSRSIGQDGVVLLREALDFARQVSLSDHAGVKSFTVELGRRVAKADLEFLSRIKSIRRQLEQRILAAPERRGHAALDMEELSCAFTR